MIFDVTWLKPLPINELKTFEQKVVYSCADITLNFTEPHIPYLSGDLSRGSLSKGVMTTGKLSYSLGYDANISPYGSTVYGYPQDTNWTNKRSYAQWYHTEWKNQKETILGLSVTRAKKGI